MAIQKVWDEELQDWIYDDPDVDEDLDLFKKVSDDVINIEEDGVCMTETLLNRINEK